MQKQKNLRKDYKISIVSNNSGITLVALVVTIVVLLILAGITINLILGPNSIFNNAKEAKDQTEIGTFKEKLGMVYTDAMLKRGVNGKLTPEEYFEILKKHGIISDTTVGGGNISNPTENPDGSKTYRIKSDDDYIFKLTIYPDGKIETEVIGKDENIEAKIISIVVTNKTKTEISIRVSATLQDESVKAYYKKTVDVAENEAEESIEGYTEITLNEDLEGTISGITAGKEYKIKVILKNGDTIVNVKSIQETAEPLVLVDSITLDKTSLMLEVGGQGNLKATINPDNAEDKTVTWSSNPTSIATVDQTGKVTGVSAGEATVTVIANDGSGITATCKITVTATLNKNTMTSEEASWRAMNRIAKAIAKDSSITNTSLKATGTTENGEKYEIGVGEIYKVKWNETEYRVRVLGFKHDDLVNTGVYGSEITTKKASISFEFYDCLGTHNMNGTSNSNSTNANGWEATEMRAFLEGAEGRGKLSNNSYLKQVKKKYIKTFNAANSVTTSNDYLWLLSCSEIFKDGYPATILDGGSAITKEGELYLYYSKNAPESYKSACVPRIKYIAGKSDAYWLRSPYFDQSSAFCRVNYSGYGSTYSDSFSKAGVAPGFCI